MSGRLGKIPVVGFIELFRGLPVVITIVFVWRAMAELDVPIDVLPGEPALWYLVIGLTLYNLTQIMEGNLDEVIVALQEADRNMKIQELGKTEKKENA